MKRLSILLSAAAAMMLIACGGGEPSNQAPPASQPMTQPAATQPAAAADASTAPMTTPDWFHADDAAKTVDMTVTAGLTAENNHWNYNGATHGKMIITVPVGAKVTIEFHNNDPVMAHSLGIVAQTSNFGASPDPNPVFPGAITSPATLTEGTNPGESETITFTAATAGHYGMVCFMAAHATTGMYILFDVSAEGKAGVQSVM